MHGLAPDLDASDIAQWVNYALVKIEVFGLSVRFFICCYDLILKCVYIFHSFQRQVLLLSSEGVVTFAEEKREKNIKVY
jgi:hypothetical protein